METFHFTIQNCLSTKKIKADIITGKIAFVFINGNLILTANKK